MATGKITSAASAAALSLMEEVMNREDGELLGSEDEMVQRLGVSKPTLRQAARVLEYQQLLTIKRGWHGGYFARRPDSRGVATMAALVLRVRDVKVNQTMPMMAFLRSEAARSACSCQDASLRARLAEYLGPVELQTAAHALERHVAFCSLVGAMSGDPLIELFTDILLAYATIPHADTVHSHPERAMLCLEHDRDLASDILARDADAVDRTIARHLAVLATWARLSPEAMKRKYG
jgi:GntR family transcriptional regulator, transcriptional repressor for pyruvate dehydrogenase complex